MAQPTMTEAPCSLNAFVDVNNIRVQVTGRGETPTEAINRFYDLMSALMPPTPSVAAEPELEPPTAPVPTLESQVASLLACGLSKATARQDWPLVARLSHAAALVLAGAVEMGSVAGEMAVRSQANPDTWYTVADRTCTCPDYQRAARADNTKHCCKHILAVSMWARLA